MSTIRLGVVGCGAICGTHAEAIREIERADLVGFYDVIEDRARTAADKHNGTAFPDLNALLNEVDAITVCVPSGHHAQVTLAAAEKGVHVLCEKPIEVNAEKAFAMVQACEGKVKLGVVSQHRMSEVIQAVRAKVQGGELGKPLACDIAIKWYRTQAYYDSGDWRGTWELDGGGCLMNQGVHYVDMGQWIMGGVRSVRAQTRTLAHERIEVEDIANALIEYNNGAVGVLQGSTSYYPGFSERIEVHGTWGTAVIEGDLLKVYEVDAEKAGQGLYGGGVMAQPAPNQSMFATGDQTPIPWGVQHRAQIADFVDALLDDRDPFITGWDALEPLRVILGVYESARRGGEEVMLDEVWTIPRRKPADI